MRASFAKCLFIAFVDVRFPPLAGVATASHGDRMNDDEAKRWPWWLPFVGPALGIAVSRLLGPFIPPVDEPIRQAIGWVAAVLIAGGLTYAIYRFARM